MLTSFFKLLNFSSKFKTQEKQYFMKLNLKFVKIKMKLNLNTGLEGKHARIKLRSQSTSQSCSS